ncbi:four-carbon acid sugar kinase family protein [Salinibacillus xinjiangensis]|uniref:Hydroxyacid dehydrogenase n=1 Tax=Salinibacillus xinjiangensis TaxID=1229268 RepID=A0A6G1X1V4_9BACI|nr:four-carbon acid sugar kinase family protein [Salinibacillus xinjiangensis]MRG84977.1 hydroxyacid dehydrogenase [Salinibacillus xinjiangensis]
MTNYKTFTNVYDKLKPVDEAAVQKLWEEVYPTFQHKMVVLDDDPTGVQTVHGVSVYTDWSEETIERGFQEDSPIFFILTNSRAFTASETEQVHRDIAERVARVAQKHDQPYLIISRGDSTLRGHYPLETEVLKEASDQRIDGEVILPFFKEGGRLTIDNTHYVQDGDNLVPAGETEFAKDRTFGYQSSHLGEWVEEKTKGQFAKEDVTYISLETIRDLDIDTIEQQLLETSDFGKVVVNAIEEADVRVFSIGLIKAMNQGKNFLFRTAAAFTKVIGNISSRPLLTRDELIEENLQNGGLVVVGSHVQKTTQQLEALKTLSNLNFIELDVHLVLDKEAFQQEVARVKAEAEEQVASGVTTVIYTKRERLDLGENKKEEELKLSVEISDAVTSIVRDFQVRPNYLIAKGGITSSDVGTNGLRVKRATVAGQIAPGIPVWKTGNESTFPHIPYVIFPGNVGAVDTLKDVVVLLEDK